MSRGREGVFPCSFKSCPNGATNWPACTLATCPGGPAPDGCGTLRQSEDGKEGISQCTGKSPLASFIFTGIATVKEYWLCKNGGWSLVYEECKPNNGTQCNQISDNYCSLVQTTQMRKWLPMGVFIHLILRVTSITAEIQQHQVGLLRLVNIQNMMQSGASGRMVINFAVGF